MDGTQHGGNSTAASADATAAAALVAQQPQGALQTATAGIERQSQQQKLNVMGFDNIETFSGGEDQWQTWSWKVKAAVSGMNGDLVELLDAAETDGVKGVEESQEHDKFVDANKVKCTRVSREMYSVLARYMNSEASTIRDGTRWSGSMGKLHANYSRRTLSRVFRV